MPYRASGVTLRPDLGGSIKELMALAIEAKLAGLRVLPTFNANKKSASLAVLTKEDFLRVPETRRGADGSYARGDYEVEEFTYDCLEYGFEHPLDDAKRAEFKEWFSADEQAGIRAKLGVLLAQELRIAAAVFNPTTWTPVSAAIEWDTVATAVPMSDMRTWREAFRDQAFGLEPNALVISGSTRDDLGLNEEIRNWIKYTEKGVSDANLSDELIAKALGIKKLIVADGRYTTTKPGHATPAASRIWDHEYAMLCRVVEGQNIEEPSLGRTMLWTEDSPDPVVIEQYREDAIRSDVFRARQNTDEKIIDTDLGYLLDNIHT